MINPTYKQRLEVSKKVLYMTLEHEAAKLEAVKLWGHLLNLAPLFFERVKVEVEWIEKRFSGVIVDHLKTPKRNVSRREFSLLFLPGFEPHTSNTLQSWSLEELYNI